jgi:hypothetical protein
MPNRTTKIFALLTFLLVATPMLANGWESKMYENGKISVVYTVVAIVVIGLLIKITLLQLQIKKDRNQ